MPPYQVQAGESWASIAGKLTGDQRQFMNLMAANDNRIMLHPGDIIEVPDNLPPNPVIDGNQLANFQQQAEQMGFSNFWRGDTGGGSAPSGGGLLPSSGAGAGPASMSKGGFGAGGYLPPAHTLAANGPMGAETPLGQPQGSNPADRPGTPEWRATNMPIGLQPRPFGSTGAVGGSLSQPDRTLAFLPMLAGGPRPGTPAFTPPPPPSNGPLPPNYGDPNDLRPGEDPVTQLQRFIAWLEAQAGGFANRISPPGMGNP